MRRARHLFQGWPVSAAWVLSCALASSTYGAPWRVDASAPPLPPGDGLSWPTAFKYLQDGLAVAGSGDEIWVAQGVYRPDQSASNPGGSNDRNETFTMVPGVKLYGGFPTGGGNGTFQARNPEVYTTTLSGAIGPEIPPGPDNITNNSFHVVTATEVTTTAVLNGFTISGGYATGSSGAGIHIVGDVLGSIGPIVARCKLTGNFAADLGGGVFLTGIHTDPTFVNCSFIGNSAGSIGGAMSWKGTGAQVTLVNCLFANNTAVDKGGALGAGVLGDIMNCTFSGNSAPEGRAIIAKGHGTIVTNSILWGGAGQIASDPGISVTVNYSDVDGGWTGPGTNNINLDPKFVNAAAGNFRLRDECPDDVSPCIDAGSDAAVPCDQIDLDEDGLGCVPPNSEKLPWDLDKATPATHWGRVFNVATGLETKVDMGAYESQHIVGRRWDISGVPSGSPPPDGAVSNPDFVLLLQEWNGLPCPGCGADFNYNQAIDNVDFLALLEHWCNPTPPCPPPCVPMEGQGASPASGLSEFSEPGSPLDGALAVMGFSSLDDYGAWLEQASPAQAYGSAVVLALLLGG